MLQITISAHHGMSPLLGIQLPVITTCKFVGHWQYQLKNPDYWKILSMFADFDVRFQLPNADPELADHPVEQLIIRRSINANSTMYLITWSITNTLTDGTDGKMDTAIWITARSFGLIGRHDNHNGEKEDHDDHDDYDNHVAMLLLLLLEMLHLPKNKCS